MESEPPVTSREGQKFTLQDGTVVYASEDTASKVRELLQRGPSAHVMGVQVLASLASPLPIRHGLPDPTRYPLSREDEDQRTLLFADTALPCLYRQLVTMHLSPEDAELVLRRLQEPLIGPSHDLQWHIPQNERHVPVLQRWLQEVRRDMDIQLPQSFPGGFWDTASGVRFATRLALAIIHIDARDIRMGKEDGTPVVRFPDAVFPDPKYPDHLHHVPIPPQRVSA